MSRAIDKMLSEEEERYKPGPHVLSRMKRPDSVLMGAKAGLDVMSTGLPKSRHGSCRARMMWPGGAEDEDTGRAEQMERLE
eukprot:1337554-Rhodomonas_salina.1